MLINVMLIHKKHVNEQGCSLANKEHENTLHDTLVETSLA